MADGLSLDLSQDGPIPLDLAFALAPGETLALVGPSGAGKTTILRSIAGLYTPRTGTIRCNGAPWFDSAARVNLPARSRRVGLVFQSYALFPHRTALDNVMEAMLDRPLAQRRATARALLERMHLTDLADRLPGALSGGQQQRVALARALARQPDVLLLDEPFSAVDRPTRRALRETILELRGEIAAPILLVTHDIEDAARIADRLCLIDHGRIIQIGPTQDVLAHPANAQAKAFFDG